MGNYYVYKELERRLTSFANKSSFTVITEHGLYCFSRMNSIYVSHRHCEISQGHGVHNLVILEANKPVIFAFQCLLEGDISDVVAFPTKKLPVLPYPAYYPDSFHQYPFISAAITNEFRGFDDYGVPSFKRVPKVYVYGQRVYPYEVPVSIPE